MEVSALRYSAGGGLGLHARTPLLRLQSDERLIALVRRGNSAAFEALVSRYHSRLLAFCRHLLDSKEDAEDVLQEVLAAAFNAIIADERPINVRPWLYRIARNRSLNHLRRVQAIGVDSMDVHFSEYGATTADKVHHREQFRLLVRDIQSLPETQRTALVLREMDALSYEQIAEAMDTTVPGVKSLLVRARISLAEAAEARQLSCDEVRIELAEVAEGLHKRPSALVRRHLRSCNRCGTFQTELKQTNKALAALLPIGPLALLRQLLIAHVGHSAGTGSGAAASATGATSATTGAGVGGVAAGQAAAVAGTASSGAAFGSAGSLISAGAGALAGKAAAGLAAAALVTGAAVEASGIMPQGHAPRAVAPRPSELAESGGATPPAKPAILLHSARKRDTKAGASEPAADTATSNSTAAHAATASKPASTHPANDATAATPTTSTTTTPTETQTTPTPRTQSQKETTVLNSSPGNMGGGEGDKGSSTTTGSGTGSGGGCSSTAATTPSSSSDQGTGAASTPTSTTSTSTTPADSSATNPSSGTAPARSPDPSVNCSPAPPAATP